MPEAIFSEALKSQEHGTISFPSRVVIEGVQPELDSGRFPIKRVVGEQVNVSANIHADGHNAVAAILLYRRESDERWHEVKMVSNNPGLDVWEARFHTNELGLYDYTIKAWIDRFANWKRNTRKKIDAGQDVSVELLEAIQLSEDAAENAGGKDKEVFLESIHTLRAVQKRDLSDFIDDRDLEDKMFQYLNRQRVCTYDRVLKVMVEPVRALYGAWYEMFPRSAKTGSKDHVTFKDAISRLPYIAKMGFDVLYLPPIHPIGLTGRKGPNNSLIVRPGDPGSPWAIGSRTGGHKSVHEQLGTLDDFEELVAEAARYGIDIALDIAFQCSPDHPYTKEHPEWFYHRPDGSIRYAENPPKQYEDIYPLDFESAGWQSLWRELVDVVLFWVEHGVRIFRVDNPHTKPYPFWSYLIQELKETFPESIFLSEAFARPPIMKHLAKCGFSQSYTYFTWRNTKQELTEYFTELTQSEMSQYLRPNLFANTPDILPVYLQFGGRPAFMVRVALAATLGASYGIYGPPFELCVGDAIAGTEEYKDSEKYQIRCWDLDSPESIASFIGRINQIRSANPALQQNQSLQFVPVDNEQIIAYIKTSDDGSNVILTVVNLDPHHVQSGWLQMPAQELGLEQAYQVHDLITNHRYLWSGRLNFVQLDPNLSPARIFHVEKKLKSEQDFDYFA